ncbi:MAG: hypothetical protein D6795_13105 [Deltaproteobacteria bacterium]|nr:MAG: hypothetical protein D6795_13105 [Deltaproteobacteria bacterium]
MFLIIFSSFVSPGRSPFLQSGRRRFYSPADEKQVPFDFSSDLWQNLPKDLSGWHADETADSIVHLRKRKNG